MDFYCFIEEDSESEEEPVKQIDIQGIESLKKKKINWFCFKIK